MAQTIREMLTAVRYTEVTGRGEAYDRLHALRGEFVAKINDGSATHTDLMNFLLLIDSCGHETIPSSVGMDWVCHNPRRFAEIVGDVEHFIYTIVVMLDCADAEPTQNHWEVQHLQQTFFRSFIGSRELMALLTPKMRDEFVSQFYPRYGANNNGWISAALRTGVSRQTISDAILTELRNTTVIPMQCSAIGDFVEYGMGRGSDSPVHSALWSLGITEEEMRALRPAIGKDPTSGFAEIQRRLAAGIVPREDRFSAFPEFAPWCVLDNAQFEEALAICAAQLPGKTLGVLDHPLATKRLSDAAKDRVAMVVLNAMKSLQDVSVETIERHLSLTGREMLARRLDTVDRDWNQKVTATFLFRIVVELDRSKREAFWTETVERVLRGISPVTLYRTWRMLNLQERDVEITLRRKLDEGGYEVGTIALGQNPKGGRQWEVCVGQYKFVEERGNHRYLPSQNDLVMFPRQGRHLTPTVIATTFYSVTKEPRD